MIVLDVQIPGRNGLDVAREIARFGPGIPILMITVYMSRPLEAAAREAGIRGACAKSDGGSIVETVDALLHNKS
jgi:DNA-binding NarL/FixJ family response regulator